MKGDRILLRPVGWVTSPARVPRDSDWGSVEATILVEEEFAAGLKGLDEFSHVLVLTFLHRTRFDPDLHLQRRPQCRPSMPLVGIFAQRAKDRPNPLGLTCVPLLSVVPGAIRVRGLDAIHGTPVLDIKPFVPHFDLPNRGEVGPDRPAVRVPGWVDRLMEGYF